MRRPELASMLGLSDELLGTLEAGTATPTDELFDRWEELLQNAEADRGRIGASVAELAWIHRWDIVIFVSLILLAVLSVAVLGSTAP